MKKFNKIIAVLLVLLMLVSTVPQAFADTSVEAITVNAEKTVSNYTDTMYSFTPTESGYYSICFYGEDFYFSHVEIFDSKMICLYGENCSKYAGIYNINFYYEADETYYIKIHGPDAYLWNKGYDTFFNVKIIKSVPATSITITNGDSVSGVPTDEIILNTEYNSDDCIPETVTYTSSNPDVVFVDSFSGRVFLREEGTATITAATESGLSDTINITVKAPDTIALDEEKTLGLDSGIYSFVPTESGYYRFYSYGDSMIDSYGAIYDSNFKQLTSCDDIDPGNFNFCIDYELTAGETYYFKSSAYPNEQSSYKVKVIKLVPATGIEIVEPVNKYYAGDTYVFSIKTIPENSIVQNCEWSSNNDGVISSVRNECYEARDLGTAKITVTAEGGLTASVDIEVVKPDSIVLGKTYTVKEKGYCDKYTFKPETDGTYKFEAKLGDDLYGYNEMHLYDDDEFGIYAFSYDSVIVATLKAGVEYHISLGVYGGEGCYSLTVTKDADGEFDYTVNDGEVTIFSYNGGKTNPVIPEKLSGGLVTNIVYGSFSRLNIANVTIPASVENIDCSVFEECNSLTDVFFKGTEEQFKNMTVYIEGNEPLINAKWHINTISDIFGDVKESSWYESYVDYVYSAGLMNGTGSNKFEPNTDMSRAMIVTIIARMSGEDLDALKNTQTKFTDVEVGKWYTGAVVWAVENGITNGTSNTTFSPTASVTREDLCVLLVRFAKVYNITLKTDIQKTVFPDDSKIAGYAKDAVYACQQAGIINGTSAGTFEPKGKATRSAVAKMVTVFHKDYIA